MYVRRVNEARPITEAIYPTVIDGLDVVPATLELGRDRTGPAMSREFR